MFNSTTMRELSVLRIGYRFYFRFLQMLKVDLHEQRNPICRWSDHHRSRKIKEKIYFFVFKVRRQSFPIKFLTINWNTLSSIENICNLYHVLPSFLPSSIYNTIRIPLKVKQSAPNLRKNHFWHYFSLHPSQLTLILKPIPQYSPTHTKIIQLPFMGMIA